MIWVRARADSRIGAWVIADSTVLDIVLFFCVSLSRPSVLLARLQNESEFFFVVFAKSWPKKPIPICPFDGLK